MKKWREEDGTKKSRVLTVKSFSVEEEETQEPSRETERSHGVVGGKKP
jgi:hypothetical protein